MSRLGSYLCGKCDDNNAIALHTLEIAPKLKNPVVKLGLGRVAPVEVL